uniref:Uncharacterized protein n=1 Tax=Ditylenchus dipsaci TaxID=166011 RepID=A0A915CX70_9BILA
METLQRIVSRQWTDLSHKRNSKRLKPFDEPFIFTEEDNNNYCLDETKPTSERQDLAFSSPLHFYNSSSSEALAYSNDLQQPSHYMSPSMSAKNIKELEAINYQLETGHLDGLSQHLLKAQKNSVTFSSLSKRCSELPLKYGTSSKITRAASQKSESTEDIDEDKPKKQTRIMEVRNKLSNGRKKKSDNQNLLMFEELND